MFDIIIFIYFDQYITGYDKQEQTQRQPSTEEMVSPDIKIITGNLKYLSLKENEYGHNHVFAVLDESPLEEIIKLKDMKMHIWENSGKYYLKINAGKV